MWGLIFFCELIFQRGSFEKLRLSRSECGVSNLFGT